jgi:hypothetical protein
VNGKGVKPRLASSSLLHSYHSQIPNCVWRMGNLGVGKLEIVTANSFLTPSSNSAKILFPNRLTCRSTAFHTRLTFSIQVLDNTNHSRPRRPSFPVLSRRTQLRRINPARFSFLSGKGYTNRGEGFIADAKQGTESRSVTSSKPG